MLIYQSQEEGRVLTMFSYFLKQELLKGMNTTVT